MKCGWGNVVGMGISGGGVMKLRGNAGYQSSLERKTLELNFAKTRRGGGVDHRPGRLGGEGNLQS